MTADEARKALAHLPPDELLSVLAHISFIIGTTEEEVVAANVRNGRPDVDRDTLETQIEALFALARLDAQRHKRDRSN